MITTLGTALLDSFEWEEEAGKSPRARETRIGGGGVYWTVGARIWLEPSQVGQLVHRGPDFPAAVQSELDAFGPIWEFVSTSTPTPHALNIYRGGSRTFAHLTPPPQLTPASLRSTRLSDPTHLHLCCTPDHLLSLIPTLSTPASQLIFEPIPYACTPAHLAALEAVLPHLLVFSPNDEEASLFFRDDNVEVEDATRRFRAMGARNVIVRCGARGSFVLEQGKMVGKWMKPYHTAETSLCKVVDTVGAGNSFLGGLCAGLMIDPEDFEGAVRRGAVSAGLMIEQAGFPHLRVNADGGELWNGTTARARLAEMGHRE